MDLFFHHKTIFRYLLTLFILLLSLTSCKPGGMFDHGPVPIASVSPAVEGLETFPKAEPVPTVLKVVNRFSDVFELERCINLELNETSVIGKIGKVLFFRDQILVLDEMQGLAFRFDEYGLFLGQIGAKGQGPGEYEHLSSIAIWNDRIVLSHDYGVLSLYDTVGQFEKTIRLTPLGIFPSGEIFFHEDRLYVSKFSRTTSSTPKHVVIDLSGDTPSPLFGFESLPTSFFHSNGNRNRRIPDWQHARFMKVGNHIWSASRYYGGLKVYDLEGNPLAKLPCGFDGLEDGDLDDVKDRADLELQIFEKFRAENLLRAGPYMLALYYQRDARFIANLYDTNGILLKKNLEYGRTPIHYAIQARDDYLTMALPLEDLHWENAVEETLGDDYATLLDDGYDPALKDEYNPWLLLYRPKQKALASRSP